MTYGAKKIRRRIARPAEPPVEQQREAERERDLDDQRQDDDQARCGSTAPRKTGSASARWKLASPTKSVERLSPFQSNRL